MTHRSTLIVLALLASRPAHAYNFGFVRAPDWMDPIVLGLLAAFLVTWGAAIATKPAGIPVQGMYQAELSPVTRWSLRAAAVLYALLMVAVFIGMGLARA